MREIKPKKLHYRRAVMPNSTVTLQQELEQLLRRYNRAAQRCESMDPNGRQQRLINNHLQQQGMEFGNFFQFESGTHRMLVTVDTAAMEMDLAQVAPPPAENGLRNEFLDSILYYGVRGNHVILLQSTALRENQWVDHINWLLRQSGRRQTIKLEDSLRPDIATTLENATIKKARCRLPVVRDAGEASDGRRVDVQRLTPVGRAVDILKSLFGVQDLDRLHLAQVAPDDLMVDVVVTYNRQTSSSGQQALNTMAGMLRNLDDGEMEFIIPGVGRIKGDDLKLVKNTPVDVYDGVVDMNDLFQKMFQWVEDLIRTGRVNNE